MIPAVLAAIAADAGDFAWTEDAIDDAIRNAPAGWGDVEDVTSCADVDPHTVTVRWDALVYVLSLSGDAPELVEVYEDGDRVHPEALADRRGLTVEALTDAVMVAWCDGAAEVVL